ncbi:universal stress protein [Streptomyces rhizosphaerihabitans]|uniref:universal stress protein n=1 Tax=Streptomyces rhizosphaerihabitans TaxID=1266770 RepID=UPI0021BE8DD6|nr:universal stress protein [Streptomyces rhizosphaerihabitans]MCT9008104.1 universal stress protein [Streptomyces rhizosphaerihabitans]
MNSGTTITAGIDGSRASLDAADWAAREAGRRRLPLRLLHAGTRPRVSARVPDVDVPAGRTRTTLDRAAIQLSYAHPALDIVARDTETPAVPALLAAAAESETLVVGSRGRTGHPAPAGFLTGSVALTVAAGATCPVVLVRAGELPEDEREFTQGRTPMSAASYRPVVLGLDLEHPADDLIGYAFDTAAVRSAPLLVVHAWTLSPLHDPAPAVPSAIVPSPGGANDQETGRRRALTGTLRPWRHKFPDVPVAEQVVHGRPGDQLLRASTGAGLLIVGRRAGERLGRAARTVIRQVTCPVVVVPHG